ncbi:kinase-like protein [Schizopora paradoxa]|uniref:Kinase-like protein n=1 Tax=Schizopora paradoxa TaxID=27342 RepID=A0A0H2S8Y9_9AGAM|nr:kinase-like protein [Schizopora paradoxa]
MFWSWEKMWAKGGGRYVTEDMANSVFFLKLLCRLDGVEGSRIKSVLGAFQWPFQLITELRGGQNPTGGRYRTYQPRSDLLILDSSFPKLLVEVQSTSQESVWPVDLIRMFLQAASIVRFTNKFLKAFENKQFVLPAIYIKNNGTAYWYCFFEYDVLVMYSTREFDLKTALGRINFIRQLYNLLDALAAQKANDFDKPNPVFMYMKELMKTGFPKNSISSTKGTKSEEGAGDDYSDDADSEDDDQIDAGASASDNMRSYGELRKQGYEPEVKPETIVNKRGEVFAPLFKSPVNIFNVKRTADPGCKSLIAKKVRKDSDEVSILKRLSAMVPPPQHIISLLDSFDAPSGPWIILPKCTSVADYINNGPELLAGKLAQICWGLVEGVGYLHGVLIAHRDIKPDNLLVDNNFVLKIIDFDVALQLEDENEEVKGDYCGTEAWMAPEVENEVPSLSPIKADRWSVGRVISALVKFGKEEDLRMLKAVATKLQVDDPHRRPSLAEWPSWKAESLDIKSSSSQTISSTTASQTRSRPSDFLEAPAAKKQKDMLPDEA